MAVPLLWGTAFLIVGIGLHLNMEKLIKELDKSLRHLNLLRETIEDKLKQHFNNEHIEYRFDVIIWISTISGFFCQVDVYNSKEVILRAHSPFDVDVDIINKLIPDIQQQLDSRRVRKQMTLY